MTLQKENKKVEDIKKEGEQKKCPVQRALYYITEFLEGPMCGRCFPCAMGTYEMRIRLQNIIEGKGTEEDVFTIKRIATEMVWASMCKKGKDTANFILEWMDTGAFEQHIEGSCAQTECIALIEYRIIPKKCTACGLCKEVCKYNAITGEKKKPYQSGYLPFEIRQKRCVKCGECIKVCPTGAIIVTEVKTGEPVGVR